MEKPKEWAKSRVTRGYWRLLALLPIVIISLVLILLRDRLAHFKTYGYSGIFLISLLGNATIILPIPSLAVVFAMGGALNPILVGLAAGIGAALGELTGFLAGYGGRVVIEDRELYARLERWMKRYGLVVIIALSAIPNPLFDLAGIAAGALRFPLWQFLVACWLGKTIQTVLIALIGARSIYFLERFF